MRITGKNSQIRPTEEWNLQVSRTKSLSLTKVFSYVSLKIIRDQIPTTDGWNSRSTVLSSPVYFLNNGTSLLTDTKVLLRVDDKILPLSHLLNSGSAGDPVENRLSTGQTIFINSCLELLPYHWSPILEGPCSRVSGVIYSVDVVDSRLTTSTFRSYSSSFLCYSWWTLKLLSTPSSLHQVGCLKGGLQSLGRT